MPKHPFIILTRDSNMALLSSLVLYNFYQGDKTKIEDPKVADVFGKLLEQYPKFFLVEINNIADLAGNLYEMDDNTLFLSLVDQKIHNDNICKPNMNFDMETKYWKLNSLFVDQIEDDFIHSYNYKHIKGKIIVDKN